MNTKALVSVRAAARAIDYRFTQVWELASMFVDRFELKHVSIDRDSFLAPEVGPGAGKFFARGRIAMELFNEDGDNIGTLRPFLAISGAFENDENGDVRFDAPVFHCVDATVDEC